jgi:ABC-type antimicrobial peptide transport system permease subunit
MQELRFNISLAFKAIITNRLRSILTIVIIGIGIMSVVGILTAIEVIKESMYSNFSSMGANSFQITSSATSPLPFSSTSGTMDLLGATYDLNRNKWDIIAFVPGY